MKIINAFDGKEVRVGQHFVVPGRITKWVKFREAQPPVMTTRGIWDITPTTTHVGVTAPGERWLLISIDPGVFSATALVADEDGRRHMSPLAVRFTHPGFFLQHVAFLPT